MTRCRVCVESACVVGSADGRVNRLARDFRFTLGLRLGLSSLGCSLSGSTSLTSRCLSDSSRRAHVTSSTSLDRTRTKSLGVDKERRVCLGAFVGSTSRDGSLGRSSTAATVEEIADLARVGDIPDSRSVHAIGIADDCIVGCAA